MADLVERLRVAERDMVQIMIGPCEERVPDLLGLAADRLTTLEAEAQENARLHGMGGEREAGLHGDIERLKRKVAALEAEASEGERRGLERVLHMQAPIDSMCMTYRHDFGLPKGTNSYGNGISGMTERDRDALRLTMRQIWEHAVLHAVRALIPEAPVRDGWRPIETAPEDENVILATKGDHVGEAIMLIDEDTGTQKWTWALGPVHPNHTPLAWCPLPAPPQDNREG